MKKLKVGQWVNVNECLPTKGSHVLGVLGCGTRLVMFFFDEWKGDGWRDKFGDLQRPVYWTPLPEVPRELR
jgi:hypothetical protein